MSVCSEQFFLASDVDLPQRARRRSRKNLSSLNYIAPHGTRGSSRYELTGVIGLVEFEVGGVNVA